MFEIVMQQNAGVLAVQPDDQLEILVAPPGVLQNLGQTSDAPPPPNTK